MTLKQPAAPESARKAFRHDAQAVEERRRTRELKWFGLAVREFAGGKSLRGSVRLEGWRSLTFGADGPSTAEARRRAGRYQGGGTNVGVFSERLAETLALADAQLQDARASYEPSLLEASGLQVAAVWFRHPRHRDVLMALPAANSPFETGRLYTAGEFEAILRDLARDRLREPERR